MFDPELKGWHYHVYTAYRLEFEKWMYTNMNGKYECVYRFNSGDPMFTVTIYDDTTLFKLTWC